MTNEFPQLPDINTLAYIRFKERTRIVSALKAILVKFPKQFPSRKRHRIATDICSLLYKEIEDRFGMI